jgi:hypothetical protein
MPLTQSLSLFLHLDERCHAFSAESCRGVAVGVESCRGYAEHCRHGISAKPCCAGYGHSMHVLHSVLDDAKCHMPILSSMWNRSHSNLHRMFRRSHDQCIVLPFLWSSYDHLNNCFNNSSTYVFGYNIHVQCHVKLAFNLCQCGPLLIGLA